MKIAITGATGFIGGHLARRLAGEGHDVVPIGRDVGLDDVDRLAELFAGCDAVAHCAGINREIGRQTYRRVHIAGTRHVVDAAKRAGVRRIAFISFLRARPDCGSPYHESKHAAEQIVRDSGLDHTVIKPGVVYGRGDHMLDHLSRALHTFPVFALVGMRDQPVRPLAVDDLVAVLHAAVTTDRLRGRTVAVTGPEAMPLAEAVRRVAQVVGRRPVYVRLPVAFHYVLAWLLERVMRVPMVSLAQVRILSEGVVEPCGAADALPADLTPRTPFTDEQIRRGLPPAEPFGLRDCRCWRMGHAS